MELQNGMRLYEIVQDLDLYHSLGPDESPYQVLPVVVDHFNGSSVYVKRMNNKTIRPPYKRQKHFPLPERRTSSYILGVSYFLTDDPHLADKWWEADQKNMKLNRLLDCQFKKVKKLRVEDKEYVLKQLSVILKEDLN